MAENDQNDEYKFVEFDNLENEMMEEKEPQTEGQPSSSSSYSSLATTDVRRNAVIAIGIFILLLILYKLIGYVFFHKNETASVQPVTPSLQSVPQPQITQAPIQQPIQQPVITVNTSDLTQKVAAVELAQQNVKDEVRSMTQQVSAVNNNINNLNNEIAGLNQVITALSNQLAKQTEEINLLMQRNRPKRLVKHISKPKISTLIYYIQAIIPGRAWLIGTNGSTLTVREGTRIAGYGLVKLIDPLEGRVVTSSGAVIRFSQEDS